MGASVKSDDGSVMEMAKALITGWLRVNDEREGVETLLACGLVASADDERIIPARNIAKYIYHLMGTASRMTYGDWNAAKKEHGAPPSLDNPIEVASAIGASSYNRSSKLNAQAVPIVVYLAQYNEDIAIEKLEAKAMLMVPENIRTKNLSLRYWVEDAYDEDIDLDNPLMIAYAIGRSEFYPESVDVALACIPAVSWMAKKRREVLAQILEGIRAAVDMLTPDQIADAHVLAAEKEAEKKLRDEESEKNNKARLARAAE